MISITCESNNGSTDPSDDTNSPFKVKHGNVVSSGALGRPFDTTQGPESTEGLPLPRTISSEVEGHASESRGRVSRIKRKGQDVFLSI